MVPTTEGQPDSRRQHGSERPVAVITGSTSGIGHAVALALARRGFDIVVHGRRAEAGEVVRQEVVACGGEAICVLADLSDRQHQSRLVEAAWNWKGTVNAWINNAGVDVLTGQYAQLPFDRKLELLWQVDVDATVRLSRTVGRRMYEQISSCSGVQPNLPTIINVGWDQARYGMAGDSGEMFAAVKGAVMAFSRSLARSLAPHVRVNCLAPGWICTGWGRTASEYWQHRARSEALLQRWGTPEDVAEVAAFLASDESRFITGQVIEINGGYAGSPVSGSRGDRDPV